MAFVTRVRIEGAGESPDAIRALIDVCQNALEEEDDLWGGSNGPSRIVEEVYDRIGKNVEWYKGRRVVWFVEPGGANDPDAGR